MFDIILVDASTVYLRLVVVRIELLVEVVMDIAELVLQAVPEVADIGVLSVIAAEVVA